MTTPWEVALDVQRQRFLPDLMWPLTPDGYRIADRVAEPEEWHRWAAEDTALVTQWDDGGHAGYAPGETPTSSSSAPSLVAGMLDDLDARPGHRVLDVGVGTGWTTALLSARVGTANVVGVEVDPGIAEAAAARLRAAGFDPRVVASDGGDGWASGAPYDRVQGTFAVRRIPPAWIAQTRPGGTIVVPWRTRFTNVGAVVRLTVDEDGAARGRFTRPAEFMFSRAERERWPDHTGYVGSGSGWPADTVESAATVGADDLWESPDGIAEFVVGLLVPEAVHTVSEGPDGTSVVWLYSLRCRSWAAVLSDVDGREPAEVYQGGPRRLWDEVEAAYGWWVERGRPDCRRFGLTVRPAGQVVWHDHEMWWV